MRVTKRLRGEERGAVMMIVAISLIVLLGMLVLTVDLGRMVAVKREMVRAADAAALAAAQECAFGNDSGAATSAALQIAGTNHDGASLASPLIFVPPGECDNPTLGGAKLVTVKVTTSLDMFFAPIFGINTGSVVAQATATWATPGAAPISVNAVPLAACKAASLQGQTECTLEYSSDQFQEPRWGILVLELWNQPDTWCPEPASYTDNIISSGGIWPLPEPVPAYDCLDSSGNQATNWQSLKGKTFWFPVVDLPNSKLANGMLVKDDPGCTKGPQCRIVSAWVTDFVKMKVLDVKPGNPEVLTVELVPSHGSIAGIEIRLVD